MTTSPLGVPFKPSPTYDEVMALLTAVVRSYGLQEVSGTAAKVIFDEYDLQSAVELVLASKVEISIVKDGLTRYIIEVRE